ncbi:transglycosylase SLT domain-containing protein [Kitasatospora sp. NPDC101183]|uniref:transglycosylase SLT domain-containing protein n=1 Tax=Kitasatospora sp. NPDC101183 TaxID=3364100 RepID=UPI00382532A8
MAELDIVGSAGVDIVPIVPTFHRKLQDAVLPIADRVGLEAGRVLGERMGDSLRAGLAGAGQGVGRVLGDEIAAAMQRRVADALPDAVQAGGRRATASAAREGEQTGGAFARSLKAKLTAAYRAMPELDIAADATGVDAELARVRERLRELSGKRIGIDIDAATASARVADLEAQLRQLGSQHPNPVVRIDTATARAALADVRAEIAAITDAPHEVELRPQGAFRERLLTQVRAATAALPPVVVDVSADDAESQLARLRAEMASIPDRLATDVRFTDAEAVATIARLRVQLAELSASSARIDIRADAAQAEAQLAVVAATVAALDAQRAEIHVDTSGAVSAVVVLGIQIAALAAIPAIPVLAAGVGGLAAAFVAAGAGAGALGLAAVPAIKGVAEALQARKAAQDEATNATNSGAGADSSAQQRALSLAGTQQSLASARRNAAQQTESATRQIGRAEQALADAVARAADEQASAARRVQDAERSLADAQHSEQQAQEDLTGARKTAAQQLEDYQSRLANGALDEREATARLTAAQRELQAVQEAGDLVTPERLAAAQLGYDRALQASTDQHTAYSRLQVDAKAASVAGVDGAQVVVSAQERLARAQRTTADASQAVADAQAAAAKTAVSSARAVADAQERVADAQRAAAQAAMSAADSVASAQRGVQQAMLASAKAAGGATTAADKYEAVLKKLSPSARQLFDAVAGPGGLSAAFKAWADSVAPDVLPLFTRGVNGAKGALPGLTPLVLGAARAIGQLEDRASAELKTPFWRGFKTDIQASAEPAILGLGVTVGNVFKGMAGIVDAFLPHIDGITARMTHASGKFANWGTGLKGSSEFERFIAYASASGPKLAEVLRGVARAVLSISEALAPLSGPVLQGLAWFAGLVSTLARDYPWLVQALWLGIAAFKVARLVAFGAAAGMAAYNVVTAIATAETGALATAMQLTGIVPLIELIVLAVAALVAGVIYAYNHWDWFRDAVLATWNAIKVAALFTWNYILKPTFDGIVYALQVVGVAAMWLWENAIGPAFSFIWDAARILFAIVVTAVVVPILFALKILGAVAMWLWEDAFKPSIDGIAAIASWLWREVLEPVCGYISVGLQKVGDGASWLWRSAISPALDGIGAGFTWLWRNAVKPVLDWIGSNTNALWDNYLSPAFEKIKSALGPVGTAFSKAKDAISAAWNSIAETAKTPVNFIIKNVYTDGIKAVWDKVADFVGLGKLPDAPKLLAAGGTVGPGWGEAAPMVVNRPTAIVGEGNPAYPEYVIPTDPRYRQRAIALHAAAGTQLMANGGILGSVVGTVKGWASDAWDATKDGAELLAHPSKIWDKLAKPVRDLFSKVDSSPFGKVLVGIPEKAITGLKDKIVNFVSGGGGKQPPPSGSGNGGSGVQQWAPVVLQALAMLGQPASWLDTVLRRMNQESGGNPTVVNNWDSNALAGTPSVGLMQVIGPTFRAYAGQFANTGPFVAGTSTDPLANTFAGLNYAIHRYGSLSALNRPGGYDNGGYLPVGTSLVYNHTGRPEPVFTTGQWDAIRAGGLSGVGDVHLEARVYVGDREITDIVRVEVARSESATATALMMGRR